MSLFKKKQTAVKGRSSALLISIIVHVVLFLIAGTFVAVQVAKYSEPKFEGKQIVRPKMKLKKLQVPVKIEKQVRKQAPKLNQRVTASPRVNMKTVDFKMPEVGGLGGASVNISGAGLGGSLGFATTQINLFGLKSSGEKIVFVLDAGEKMLVDEVGGIPAYKIIKNELAGLIGNLPPTALFNVIVFDGNNARAFSQEMCTADGATLQKLKDWLAPLNNDKRRTGFSTLPAPHNYIRFEAMDPIFNSQGGWIAGVTYALQKGADSVYWLGSSANLRNMHKETWEACKRGQPLKYANGWPPGTQSGGFDYEGYGIDRWRKLRTDAYKKFNEENQARLAKGQPVRVIPGGERAIVQAYFPSAPLPERKSEAEESYSYSSGDIVDYVEAMGRKYASQDRRAAMIGLKQKKLSFNVIHFVPQNTDVRPLTLLRDAARKLNGDYTTIQGMKAIESAAAFVEK